MLKTHLSHSIIEVDQDGCPVAVPRSTLRFKHLAAGLEGSKHAHYELAVYRLASALFDEVDLKLSSPEQDHDANYIGEVKRIRRKNNVANWIRWYVGDSVRTEVRAQIASPNKTSGERIIFSYLSGGFLEDACKHAIDAGNIRLATLLAQASGGGSDDEYRLDLLDQLSVWRSGGVDVFVSPDYRRIVELLSGNVLFSKGNGKREGTERVEDVAIVGGLDWVRAFSLFLHFDQRFEAGLEDTVAAYEASIGVGDGDHVVAPPLPPYLERDVKPGSKRFRDLIRSKTYHQDILFALLKLYADADYSLDNLAEPQRYSADKCSFALAFHLVQVFANVLHARDFNDRVNLGVELGALAQAHNLRGNSAQSDTLCASFATQLENLGEWSWAAFVLLHLEMGPSRVDAIKSILSRNIIHIEQEIQTLDTGAVSEHTTPTTQFLVHQLQIPIEWIFEAYADHACYAQDRFTEYRALLRAGLFSRAHDVAVIYLAPEGIVRHDFALILDLFAPFRAQKRAEDDVDLGEEMEVPGWSTGGQVYLDYIAICRTLPWLVATHAPTLSRVADSLDVQDLSFSAIEDMAGHEAAAAATRIDRMASKIPNLVERVTTLFDGLVTRRGHSTTTSVAKNQMIASLHNCIRSLRATRTLIKLSKLIPSLDVDLPVPPTSDSTLTGPGALSASTVEVDSLQFMANSYCSAMMYVCTSPY